MGILDKFKKKHDPSEEKLKSSIKVMKLIQTKNYAEALTLQEKFFDKNSEADWYSKGNLLNNLGRLEEAIDCYKTAIQIDDKYTKAYYRLGQIFFYANRFSEANQMFVNASISEREHESNEWNTACWFFNMLCLHGAYLEFKDNKILESRNKHITKFREIISIDKNTTDDEFIEYCINNFSDIAKELEPKVIADFRVRYNSKKIHGSKIITDDLGEFRSVKY